MGRYLYLSSLNSINNQQHSKGYQMKQVKWVPLKEAAQFYSVPYNSLYRHFSTGRYRTHYNGNLCAKNIDIETYMWARLAREKSGTNEIYRNCVKQANETRMNKKAVNE
jgi:hypothetical protein